MNKAIFLDKDGTLIKDVPYNVDTKKIVLYEGVVEALAKFQKAGFLLVIITNQSGIAHGYFSEDALEKVKEKISYLLHSCQIQLSGFYYCPHHPEGIIDKYAQSCLCRKPRPGLLQKASKDLSIDLQNSWMVGDILDDIEAGKNAGCKTLLFDNGNEKSWNITSPKRKPDYIVKSFYQMVHIILKQAEKVYTHV